MKDNTKLANGNKRIQREFLRSEIGILCKFLREWKENKLVTMMMKYSDSQEQVYFYSGGL